MALPYPATHTHTHTPHLLLDGGLLNAEDSDELSPPGEALPPPTPVLPPGDALPPPTPALAPTGEALPPPPTLPAWPARPIDPAWGTPLLLAARLADPTAHPAWEAPLPLALAPVRRAVERSSTRCCLASLPGVCLRHERVCGGEGASMRVGRRGSAGRPAAASYPLTYVRT